MVGLWHTVRFKFGFWVVDRFWNVIRFGQTIKFPNVISLWNMSTAAGIMKRATRFDFDICASLDHHQIRYHQSLTLQDPTSDQFSLRANCLQPRGRVQAFKTVAGPFSERF